MARVKYVHKRAAAVSEPRPKPNTQAQHPSLNTPRTGAKKVSKPAKQTVKASSKKDTSTSRLRAPKQPASGVWLKAEYDLIQYERQTHPRDPWRLVCELLNGLYGESRRTELAIRIMWCRCWGDYEKGIGKWKPSAKTITPQMRAQAVRDIIEHGEARRAGQAPNPPNQAGAQIQNQPQGQDEQEQDDKMQDDEMQDEEAQDEEAQDDEMQEKETQEEERQAEEENSNVTRQEMKAHSQETVLILTNPNNLPHSNLIPFRCLYIRPWWRMETKLNTGANPAGSESLGRWRSWPQPV